MKEARLVHIMTPYSQFMGYTRQSNHEPLVTLTEAVVVSYSQGKAGPMRRMSAIKSDKDYSSDEVIIRGDCAILQVSQEDRAGSLYRQYMETLHPKMVKRVEPKLVAPNGAALN